MNVAQAPCASSQPTTDWRALNWAQIQQRVKKLQIRIVKAVQAGQHSKVKALQWLLTHSFSGKALAVRRVTENQGKRTPGVDGECWSTPQCKANAIGTLRRHGYQPKPLRRVYIPKRDGAKRPLDIPTIKDRAMQALYKLALDPIAETTADGNSYGFRLQRGAQDALSKCSMLLSKRGAAPWVLEADIQSCFNQISHEWLEDQIPLDQVMLGKWLKAGYVYRKQLYPTDAGTPQGGIISPTLANMALDGLEKVLSARFARVRTEHRRHKVKLVRYADDFIVTGTSKELLENEVKPVIEAFLSERGLTLSAEKTKITHIDDGFDFLGMTIRKYKGKLRIKPAKANVKAFLANVRSLIKGNATLPQAKLIRLLNPVIRGWANYQRNRSASRAFNDVDHAIFQQLWRWCRRRHPQKGRRWIKHRYFHTSATRKWNFAASDWKLFRASEVKIQRYRKIRSEANPYCPKWEIYFEQRLGQKMADDVSLSLKLKRLWISHKGRCLQCRNLITQETGWHIHHQIPKVKGGKDTLSNLRLLHPHCHRQVHSQDEKLESRSLREFREA